MFWARRRRRQGNVWAHGAKKRPKFAFWASRMRDQHQSPCFPKGNEPAAGDTNGFCQFSKHCGLGSLVCVVASSNAINGDRSCEVRKVTIAVGEADVCEHVSGINDNNLFQPSMDNMYQNMRCLGCS